MDTFRILDTLRPTATGLDAIPAWFLRIGAPVFAAPLAQLFNQSVVEGAVPSQWRTVVITPIPKVPKPTQAADYRPISITPVLSRSLEKYIVRLVRTFIYGPITIAIRARFEYDSSSIQLQHATTRYEVFRALAYEIDSSTPRESVVGVSCMFVDSSMHTIFTLYLYRPTLHRVCEYARNCLYKRN